jgi:putative hemolysin
VGEKFAHDNWTFEIVDMDGRKIDKLIAAQKKRARKEPQAAAD